MGHPVAHRILPFAIAFGALIKPQFLLYAGLLLFLGNSRVTALLQIAAIAISIAAVHILYSQMSPFDWSDYTQALVRRTIVEKDFAWGPAGFMKHFSDENAAAVMASAVGFIVVASLAFVTWRKSSRTVPHVATLSLMFIVLTFANPRMPPYDVFAAMLALTVCCAFASRPKPLASLLALVMALNLVPWAIKEFSRVPSAWPWWAQDIQIGHLGGLLVLLVALSSMGMSERPQQE